ncbi:hypothetical protein [Mesorhizobium sp. B2-4-15]|nr:hypothetical protein [Mesorhizobium sp. B2-4-15]
MDVQRPGAGWGDLPHRANGVRSLALAGGVALHAIKPTVILSSTRRGDR